MRMKAYSLVLLMSMLSLANAQTIQTDRYTKVRVGPAPGQIEPLKEVTRIVFGQGVETVGQAIEEILDGTGYRLRHIKDSYEKPIDSILMSQPLPDLHRQLGPMTVMDALETLAGEAWHVRYNDLGRELWFVINPYFAKDKSRLQRLLQESRFSKAESKKGEGEFYVRFPAGNASTPKNNEELNQFLKQVHVEQLNRIEVLGQSHSRANNSSAKLAKQRAQYIVKKLREQGIPADKVKVSYDYRNQQAQSRSGALLSVHYEEGAQQQPHMSGKSEAETKVVEAPTVYRFYRGEDLETALRRWVSRAGYRDLVWDVRDRDQHFVTIPIAADATFNCDFLECLRRVKKAYAEADSPRYFDITARGGNQIITIQLLHLANNS